MILYRNLRGPATLRFERVLPANPDRAFLCVLNLSPFRIVLRLIENPRRKKGFPICLEPGESWFDKRRCHRGPVSLRSVGGLHRGEAWAISEYVTNRPRRKP